eukprot:m.14865 g.14865  ORF g.14865 m.14865 type:complete len:270 (-) comp10548_c0_seq1:199-1008(-)
MDRLRIVGPETSVRPSWSEDNETKSAAISKTSPRTRKPDEPRKTFAKTNVVGRAKGSAYLERGNTKVIVSCFGPRDLLRTREYFAEGKLDCEFKFAPFASRRQRRGHMQDEEEKELSSVLSQTLSAAVRLDQYPKSLIDLSILVLEDDGSAFAAAVTCAAIALADAGIEMLDMVCACTVCRVAPKSALAATHGVGSILVDPTEDDVGPTDAVLTVSYMPAFDEICGLVQTGAIVSGEDQEKALRVCIEGCTKAHIVQEATLVAPYTQQP